MSARGLAPRGGAGLRWLVLAVPPALFLGVFFAWPVAAIVGRGLTGGAVLDVVTDRGLRGVAWFTLWQAVASTLLTLLLALPGAYVLARYDFRGRQVVRALVTVPFVLPSVVVGAAFLGLLGRGGPLAGLGLQQSVAAVLIAHAFFNYAVVVRTVGGLWAHLDPALEQAARVLGATRWKAFRHVTLPLLRPAIAAAATIVFLFSFTSFGVVLVLGGPTRVTIEVEVYRQTAQLLDLRTAAALTLVQLGAVVALVAVHAWAQRRRAGSLRLRPANEVLVAPRGRQRALLAANLVVMAVLLGVPVASLVERSFAATGGGYGLASWRALSTSRRGSTLFVSPLEALANSLAYAVGATAIAVVVGGLAAYAVARHTSLAARGFDVLLMLPLGTSAVTVGFGFLIALDRPPLDLRGSAWLVPIAQALVATPLVVRTLVPVLRAVDHRLKEAAATLGASPWRVLRAVELPLVGRALLVGAGFAFAVSLGEFGATVFLARPDRPTLPVAIVRLLGQPGPLSLGQAMAMSTILLVATVVAMLAIEGRRVGEVSEL
ncbi:MAG: iron ABC transporter permease [Acidimicrobiales bacterium]